MKKSLIPLFGALALCGASATAIALSSAHAQPAHKTAIASLVPADGLAGDAGAPADRAGRLRQFCSNAYARQAAKLAYLEAKLELTASQEAPFQRWKDVKLGIAKHHAETCGQRPQQARAQDRMPSLVDSLSRRQDRLKQRLADLESEKPALTAFYDALSPAQKVELGRGAHARRGHRGGQGMMGRFGRPGGSRGAMPMDRPAPPPPQ